MFIGAPFSASYLVVPRHLPNNAGEKKWLWFSSQTLYLCSDFRNRKEECSPPSPPSPGDEHGHLTLHLTFTPRHFGMHGFQYVFPSLPQVHPYLVPRHCCMHFLVSEIKVFLVVHKHKRSWSQPATKMQYESFKKPTSSYPTYLPG